MVNTLFASPAPSPVDSDVRTAIDELRSSLRHSLREPQQWTGLLRRSLLAKAVQGSNSIEGYVAQRGPVPDDLQPGTGVGVQGLLGVNRCQGVMTVDEVSSGRSSKSGSSASCSTLLRSPHFMLPSHDLDKWPGRYRRGAIYVHE